MKKTQLTIFALVCTALVALLFVSIDAEAYSQYSVNETGNCATCHGDFNSGVYTSLHDGASWGDDLHDVHRIDMLGGDCDTCHSPGPRGTVVLDSSVGGSGLAPVSCVGCHGRALDDSVANGGACTYLDCGPGAGLQQHHFSAGVTVCTGCHLNANPANYTPVGEDVPPEYYANPGTGHPFLPSDPCSDDFVGGPTGLDNDGDGDYDGDDADCGPPAGCTSDAECDNGEFCDGAETCNIPTGECLPGTPVNVDDGVACTDDSCDEVNDVVVNAPNDGFCDNGEFCDGAETCDSINDCQAGTPPVIDDGVVCTDDSCDEVNDVVVNAPNDGLCDNGEFCDGSETCDAINDCQAGTPPVVDDGVGCTDDSCDEVNDVVVNAPNDGLCDDGAFCNGSETCDAINDCLAGTPPCDPATETCDEAGDVCEPIGCQSDAECDNGMFCDGSETCDIPTGECLPGTPVNVDDGVACTDDSCDEVNDVVVNAPNDGLCDNGMFCDGSETCDAINDCQAGTPPVIDDGVVCTDDSCDEVNDVVVNAPNDGLCDNGEFCDGSETCDAINDCQAGTPPVIDDGVVCTDDSCDEVNDVVVNAPNDGLCDNGEFCDGSETCDAINDCLAGTPPCDPATETCDEAGDVCEPIGCQSDAECDNGMFCDGDETCDIPNGECLPGTPVNVDDGVACTDDSCDEVNDVVVNAPNDGFCDNGQFCDGSETCDAINDCQAGTPPVVDDGVVCTDDSCDEVNDVVVNAPNDGLCDNGEFCDGSETCDAINDCQAGTPPVIDDGVVCTDDSCDEVNDVVVNAPNDGLCDNGEFCDGSETCDAINDCLAGTPPCDPATETCDEAGDVCEPIGCQSDAECDNGMFCDGDETCDIPNGECLPGTPVNVDDGVACTDDSCDEVNDVVVNAPNDGFCDNGQFCDGSETCDAINDCQAGTPPVVDDGVGCTDDSCDEVNDVVVNAPNDGLCDNGEFCDGSETCDAINDCQAGTPPVIDDGVVCTDDSCDEVNDVVVNAPNDGLCDNGEFCDGSETCDAINDCLAGTPPCDPATETCDEAGDVCEPIGCQSDAECDNGMFCDGDETCDIPNGECLPGTPVNVDDGVACTDDSCDEVNDVVVNAPNDGFCDNGEFCDGSETCDAINDCQAGTPPVIDDGVVCTDDSCDEVNDVVVNAPNDGLCDNGEFCDGSETCDAINDCLAGTPPVVDDGVVCTDDSCDEVNDVVVNAPNDGLCDNGEFCDGSETCDAINDCQAGTPPVVDDGVGCTDDSCDEVNDVVVNAPNDGFCDNDQFCDGSETCDAINDCLAGTPPCDPATETCDEAGDVCEPIGCQSDAECDNGMFCDGSETCDIPNGECLPGTPVNVDDGVACTDDSCDEVNDVVVNAPNDGLCDNDQFCDGSETCDAINDCLAGTPPCDPATETCDEAGDVCEPIGCQSDAECDNGMFCDGSETCDIPNGECLPGTPVNVDDGVACTDDSCDEVNDVVVNAPNDGFCDNGEFCDGSETCDAINDCQAGTPPCDPATETCDEAGDVCELIGGQTDADHFLSYSVQKTKHSPNFETLEVFLKDQFLEGTFRVDKLEGLLNPADKNGEGINDPDTHLLSYKVKELGDPGDFMLNNILVENQFGAFIVDVEEPDHLLVPASKSLFESPPPPDPEFHNVDHFLCYKIKNEEETPTIQVLVQDQFNNVPKLFDIKEPKKLCNPVDKNGEGINLPDNHLLCYQVMPAKGEQRHKKIKAIFVNDQFGPNQVDTQKEKELCVPSTTALPTLDGIPGWDSGT